MDATLRQSAKLLELFVNTPGEQVQRLLESGLLADLRDVDVGTIDRGQFRKFIGWSEIPYRLTAIMQIEYRGGIVEPNLKTSLGRPQNLEFDFRDSSGGLYARVLVNLGFGMIRVKLWRGLVYVLKDSRISPLSSREWTTLIEQSTGNEILFDVLKERLRLQR